MSTPSRVRLLWTLIELLEYDEQMCEQIFEDKKICDDMKCDVCPLNNAQMAEWTMEIIHDNGIKKSKTN